LTTVIFKVNVRAGMLLQIAYSARRYYFCNRMQAYTVSSKSKNVKLSLWDFRLPPR